MSGNDHNPIDLTLDDDEYDYPAYGASRPVLHPVNVMQPPTSPFLSSQISPTTNGPSMSPFTRPTYATPPLASPSIFAPPVFPGAPNPFATHPSQPYTPAFASPFAYRTQQQQIQQAPSPPPSNNVYHQHFQRAPVNEKQVIDLTSSPSPPPSSMARVASQSPLPQDLPPKTPVCIGQLTVTALVLYPTAYTTPQNGNGEAEWAAVRLCYEHTPHKEVKENISIRTPSSRDPNGGIINGENFSVVEKKAATYLGPMLGKGLIRLECMIRKGPSTVCTQFLIKFTSDCLSASYIVVANASLHPKRQHSGCLELSTAMPTALR